MLLTHIMILSTRYLFITAYIISVPSKKLQMNSLSGICYIVGFGRRKEGIIVPYRTKNSTAQLEFPMNAHPA